MTGSEQHYAEAERLTRQAGTWMNADTGWKADLTGKERLAYRMADIAEAQMHLDLIKASAEPNDEGTSEN